MRRDDIIRLEIEAAARSLFESSGRGHGAGEWYSLDPRTRKTWRERAAKALQSAQLTREEYIIIERNAQ